MGDEWLDKLKVGDSVVIETRYARAVCPVTHTTKTQIHAGDQKFRRSDGYGVNKDAFYSVHLCEATPELVATVRAENKRRRLLQTIGNTQWKDLTTEVLEQIVGLLPKEAQP